MTLKEFHKQAYEELIQFTEFWENKSDLDPNYPKEMPEGDWQEQLEAFAELVLRKK